MVYNLLRGRSELEGRVRLPDGEEVEAPRLQVHVGQWPDSSGYEEDIQAFA
jgi:hypothetical protein